MISTVKINCVLCKERAEAEETVERGTHNTASQKRKKRPYKLNEGLLFSRFKKNDERAVEQRVNNDEICAGAKNAMYSANIQQNDCHSLHTILEVQKI